MASSLFISHSSQDDDFVRELRTQLAAHGVEGWIDSRQLRGGDGLWSEIAAAIENCDAYLAVVSPAGLQSAWLGKELKHALAVQTARKAAGQDWRVVPLSLDSTRLGVLEALFSEEILYVPASSQAGGVAAAINPILVALGLRLPADGAPAAPQAEDALEELVLELTDCSMQEQDGKQRAVARARLLYKPAKPGQAEVISAKAWRLQAPIGPIEAEDLRWYLEKYAIWPGSAFAERKAQIESKLQHWGGLLYEQAMQQAVCGAADSALSPQLTQQVLSAWAALGDQVSRRFSVWVDGEAEHGASETEVRQAREAAGALLALPWELLHDGRRFFFQGAHATRVRRRLPGTRQQKPLQFDLPIRVLVLSPRPENASCDYIDHRISAKPLTAAAHALPGQVDIHILQNPSFTGLEAELRRAKQAGQAYHVLHFDGHGVYDPHVGLGGLCFEHPEDSAKWEQRRHELIYTDKLGPLLDQHRIALVFLEACQSATAQDATDSVATALLKSGVASVVAMSHSVLVSTARRFVETFYHSLAAGQRVGDAMLAAQQDLAANTVRGRVFGEGDFHLQDWFVPVLYQEQSDPALFRQQPAAQTVADYQTTLRHWLGETPAAPPGGFIGRSRELLALQRRLLGAGMRYCVIVGQGGEGKTALAAECARWLLHSQQLQQVAFVSVELHANLPAVLDALGRQLAGADYSVAQYSNLDAQCAPIERALRERRTLLLLDNMESILPPPWLNTAPALQEQAGQELAAILSVMQRLNAVGESRLIFTSREALPAPFAAAEARMDLAHLDVADAVALIEAALGGEAAGAGAAERARLEQIEALAHTVHCHARTLALLGPNLRACGVAQTQAALQTLMEKMARDYPGEREKSLFASVELSLARLSPANRHRARVLGLFHGAVQLNMLRAMMEWPEEEIADLAQDLVQTGLARLNPYQHLSLQAALCPYLARQLSGEESAAWAPRWQAVMRGYVEFLVQQQAQNAELAATLTELELANLFALLAQLEKAGDAAAIIGLATRLHGLLQNSGKTQLSQRVGQVRDAAQAQLGAGWSHAHFEAARTRIEQSLAAGQMPAALAGAQALLQQALAAGAEAYPDADYDCAGAHFLLGQVLRFAGHAQAALPLLQAAGQAFMAAAARRPADSPGKAAAEGMASNCLTEQADCLCDLGQYDAAAAAYQSAIAGAEQRGAVRSVAVGKGQLATVYWLQKRYQQALEAYEAARNSFAALHEHASVATILHQIGMVHAHAGKPERAEDAYRQSLAIEVRLGNAAGQASTLGQLGNLYDDHLQRPEQAVVFYQQALDIYIALEDKVKEGMLHNNLADTLCRLGNLPAAREHIRQAIACKAAFGHAATPWTSWGILFKIETAAGNHAAARDARQQACALYLAYRRDGGENHSGPGRLCAAIQTILHAGDAPQAQSLLQELAAEKDDADNVPWQALLAALLALSQGSRDPAVALDARLDYDDAAELMLLLENLPPVAEAGQ
ncbi:CHAT domain-containing protein [Massilia sp. W12]|uniref:CHAT domain-containing protein n=1 Tax=Massilia sp. W12 TaxID=3126507 RepID=UPI0030D615B9